EARFLPWDAGAPPSQPPCPKCGGTGAYGSMGVCFACKGSGTTAAGQGDPGQPVYVRAGFRRETADERTEYFVLPEVFRKELSEGFDPVWLGKLLMARQLLEPDSRGKVTQNHRLPGLGPTRVYHILPDITGI